MGDAPVIHELRLMTSPEVRDALPGVGCLLIPVGSCEQHGPNIGLGADAAQADAYARLVAERMHPRVIVAPTINYGLSEHHMHFAGSITLTAQTFINLCVEVARGVARHGVHHVLFLNGHGGNNAALSVVCEMLHAEHGLQAAHTTVGTLGALEQASKLFQGRDVGHACEFEVSSAMYLCPDLVREATLAAGDLVENKIRHTGGLGPLIHRSYHWEERSRNGVLGNAPAAASADHGREITERGLHMLSEFLEDFMALPAAGKPADRL
jgi:creatinine amidohydrolase